MGKASEKFTPRLAMQLAAPHTWAASIIPVLCAVAMSYAVTSQLYPILSILLLIISVLMQSAVNSINDYFDYKKGADTENDALEESDSVLVYNDIDPRCALYLACAFVAAAFLLGIICIIRAGYIPLVIAIIGCVIVFLYSGGKTPISYLPIGEFVSGFVMGGLIPLACFQVLTLQFEPMVLLWSIPCMVGIALIMMTNNGSDIEKDIAARRRTLPCLIGRRKTIFAYRALSVAWAASICLIVCVYFSAGFVVLPFFILAAIPLFSQLWKNDLMPASRIAAMGRICSCNIVFNSFYAAAIFASVGSIML